MGNPETIARTCLETYLLRGVCVLPVPGAGHEGLTGHGLEVALRVVPSMDSTQESWKENSSRGTPPRVRSANHLSLFLTIVGSGAQRLTEEFGIGSKDSSHVGMFSYISAPTATGIRIPPGERKAKGMSALLGKGWKEPAWWGGGERHIKVEG